MQHGGDYGSYYAPQYPSPVTSTNPSPSLGEFPPSNPIQPSYASAPPYSQYSSDYVAYSSSPEASYAPYSQSPEPASNIPPSAPSYGQTQSQLPTQTSQFPSFQPFNSSPYPPEPLPAPPVPSTYPHLQQPSSATYYPFDPNQQTANFAPTAKTSSNQDPSTGQNSSFSSSYPFYDAPFQGSAARIDQGNGYFNENSGSYGGTVTGGYAWSHNGFEQDFYEKRPESGLRFDRLSLQDDALNDGAYAYDGGRSEPYGARGTVPTRSQALFDDYGRSLSFPSGGKDQGGSVGKIVRAVPKVDTQEDVKNGVQKFRVKLLPEGGGQGTMDVLCQIGLDGIRMLDPSSNRTLRIYSLETLTRWEVTDSTTFTFWSKSSVDIDPRCIRLQSNSYTTNTILDTVTAATVQLKEMGGKDSLNIVRGAADAGKQSEQLAEKKKGLIDWMNLIKPANEEKDHWVPDEAVTKCTSCGSDFGAFNRRHHCRNCGDVFCDKCTQGRIALTADENAQPVRVCDRCMAEVSQRLSNANEVANKSAASQSHEDLARKLQEEMDKNRKSSQGSKSSDGSGRRMREVACPICTVHLQVQVPASGSETIECGVCQNPFLVSAH